MKSDLNQALGNDDDQGLEADESYENHIELPDSVLQEAQEGDEIEVTVKGTVVKKPDGSVCLQAEEVNGDPVPSEASKDNEQTDPSEGDSSDIMTPNPDKLAAIKDQLQQAGSKMGY